MRVEKQPVFSQTEVYQNINRNQYRISIPNDNIIRIITDNGRIDRKDINKDKIDIEKVINEAIGEYLKIIKYRWDTDCEINLDSYISELFGGSFIFRSTTIDINFKFESDNDINHFKIKNPEVYHDLIADDVRIIKLLLKRNNHRARRR